LPRAHSTRGSNGRIMLAAGIVIAAAGLYHVSRGGTWSRWLVGLAGGGALAFSGYLLIRLTQSIRALAGEPRWLAALDQSVAAAVAPDGAVISVLLAAVFVVIAVAIYVPAATRPALILSIVIAAAIWVIGENFGGILTGQATDPNSGPLLVLLAFAFWPLGRARSAAAWRPLTASRGQVVVAAQPM
jgi:Na+/phosphate symporter